MDWWWRVKGGKSIKSKHFAHRNQHCIYTPDTIMRKRRIIRVNEWRSLSASLPYEYY